ncbi:MAG TPA: hypothetical protein VK961_24725 [Chthoniobacter sp.]|nr:hypothetical protein [Chthoniobacter sp.]
MAFPSPDIQSWALWGILFLAGAVLLPLAFQYSQRSWEFLLAGMVLIATGTLHAALDRHLLLTFAAKTVKPRILKND